MKEETNMNSTSFKTRVYYISFFLFNFGRTIPHAILTIFLLSRGLSLDKIALLQISYMIAVILIEFPSGLICDLFNRKIPYIISLIFIFISYTIIYYYSDFNILLLAWFLYGASMAMFSGSIDNDLINEIKEKELNLKKFNVNISYISNISGMLGAFLGSLMYFKIYSNIYFFSLICFLLSLFSCFFIKQDKKNIMKGNIRKKYIEMNKGIKNIFKNISLIRIILLISATSLFTQIFYQYWQILYERKNIPSTSFGYVYSIFSISSIIGAYIFEKVRYKNYYNYIIFSIMLILSIIVLIYSKGLIFFIMFPLIIIIYSIYASHISLEMKKIVPSTIISSTTSLTGVLTNLTSVLSLLIISSIVNIIKIELVYIYMIVSFICINIILLSIKNKSEK